MPATRAHPSGHRDGVKRQRKLSKTQLAKVPSVFGSRSMLDLPVELQMRVIDYAMADAGADKDCLFRLVRVCKSLYNMLIKRLYTSVILRDWTGRDEPEVWPENDWRRRQMRTLQTNKQLASYVENLFFLNIRGTGDEVVEDVVLKCVNASLIHIEGGLSFFDHAWDGVVPGPEKLVLSGCMMVNMEALTRMTRLRDLAIINVRQLIMDHQCELPRLKSLSIDLNVPTAKRIEHLFHNLTALQITLHDADQQDYFASVLPSLTQLKSLCLVSEIFVDELYGADLCPILHQMESLEELELQDVRLCENFTGVWNLRRLLIIQHALPLMCSRRDHTMPHTIALYETLKFPHMQYLRHVLIQGDDQAYEDQDVYMLASICGEGHFILIRDREIEMIEDRGEKLMQRYFEEFESTENDDEDDDLLMMGEW